ncbi:MAG: hypothetical protein U9R43_13035 [Thermodesulfobacteriota bacterium]|nr:hypothetical protein [Thermodesulfobacteriota bacterium]
MKISISPKQLGEKLGIKDIPDVDSKRIQQWIGSITIEKFKTESITPDQFKIKQFNFNHLDKAQSLDTITNLSIAYRYLFTNAYGEFIFYPSEKRKFSLQELLDVNPNTMFPTDTIYSFPLSSFRRKSSIDKSIYEYPMFCHDPEMTFQNIKRKLERRGHAAIIHDEETGDIVGFSFGYRSSLIEAWSLEEWVHPFVYSRFDQLLKNIQKKDTGLSKTLHDRYFKNFDDFLLKFNTLIKDNSDEFALTNSKTKFGSDDFVYIFNAIVTHPQIRTISKPSELCGFCLSMIDEHTRNSTLTLGEAVFQSNAYKMFQIGGMKDIYGVLNQSSGQAQTGDNILMTGPLFSVLEAALLPHREFMKRYILFHRKNKIR